MEHIVQFAIGIDDEAIRKRIEENAFNKVVENLMDDAKLSLPKTGYGAYFNTKGGIDWRSLMCAEMNGFIERNREEIIQAAAERLCEHIKRTKAYKETMGNLMEGQCR